MQRIKVSDRRKEMIEQLSKYGFVKYREFDAIKRNNCLDIVIHLHNRGEDENGYFFYFYELKRLGKKVNEIPYGPLFFCALNTEFSETITKIEGILKSENIDDLKCALKSNKHFKEIAMGINFK